MNKENLYAPRDQPEKENKREKERKKERKKDTGWASFSEWGPLLYFQKGLLYLDLYIEGNERCKVIHTESAQTFQQFCPYWNQDFFCIPFPQMMLCRLSSGLGGLSTFYEPLLIKAAQPENWFSLKVFFLYISNLCQPQKMLKRVTFLMEQRCSELQERTN